MATCSQSSLKDQIRALRKEIGLKAEAKDTASFSAPDMETYNLLKGAHLAYEDVAKRLDVLLDGAQ